RLVASAPPRPSSTPELPKTPLAFVWHMLVRGYRGHAVALAVLIAASAAIDTAQPYVLGQLVNGVTQVDSRTPIFWFALLCATWLFGYLIAHAQSTFSAYTQISLRARIHDVLFGYLHDHAPRYFLDHASGALAQKIRTSAVAAGAL